MKIDIKNKYPSGVIICSYDVENIKEAVLRAIKDRIDLSEAYLPGVDLSGADLSGADLSWAYLSGANLSGANLSGANLSRVQIDKKDLISITNERTIVGDGELIGYKKLNNNTICKLLIPESAGRVGGLIGRKCRAEFAKVIEGNGFSLYDKKFQYKIGATVKPDKFDPNPLVECSHGVHFFITREEAEEFQM